MKQAIRNKTMNKLAVLSFLLLAVGSTATRIGAQNVLASQGSETARKVMMPVVYKVPGMDKVKAQKQEPKPRVRFINPPTLPKTAGYSQVVEVTKARLIYISGQFALDRSGNMVGRGDFRAHKHSRCLKTLRRPSKLLAQLSRMS
jgi:hypothetical protein